MCLGDSLTLGAGEDTQGGGYRYFLKERLDARLFEFDFVGRETTWPGPLLDREHEGRGGWTTADHAYGRGNVPGAHEAVLLCQPDVVLVMLGRNDPDPLNIPARTSDYRALLDALFSTKPKLRVHIANVLPARERDAYELARLLHLEAAIRQAVLERVLAGFDVRFVDAMRQFPGLPEHYSDAVHLSDLGYASLADVWFREVFRRPVEAAKPAGWPGGLGP
jgi:serralysin